MSPIEYHINAAILGAYMLLSKAHKLIRSEEGHKAKRSEELLTGVDNALEDLRTASHLVVAQGEERVGDSY